jgi:hypothetical protein
VKKIIKNNATGYGLEAIGSSEQEAELNLLKKAVVEKENAIVDLKSRLDESYRTIQKQIDHINFIKRQGVSDET